MSNLEKHLIDASVTAEMAEAYVKSNYAEINKKRPVAKPDSKEYSIDLEVLQEYLKLISGEMESRGISSKGVKVTLGKYPDKSDDPKLKPAYQGYQMIFFSPVDLNPNHDQNKASAMENSTTAMGEIPDLNYMSITPPF